jgi:hypothetical protein
MATWRWADLSTVAKPPAPVAGGDPFAYGVVVCDEGGPTDFDTGGCSILVARVVFRGIDNKIGSSEGDIYELNLDGQWYCNNLCAATTLKGASPGTYNDPTAYVSGGNNGVATVNYVATSSVCQLSLPEGGNWSYASISGVTIPVAFPAEGRAFGYWDSYNSVDRVVFRGTPPNDHEIYELSKPQNQPSWACNNLLTNDKSEPPAPPAAGDPFGYCYGGVPRVIYRGTNGHIYELHPDPFWQCNDLSTIAKATSPAQVAAGDPFGYETGDSIPRVVYRGTNGQICELALY